METTNLCLTGFHQKLKLDVAEAVLCDVERKVDGRRVERFPLCLRRVADDMTGDRDGWCGPHQSRQSEW